MAKRELGSALDAFASASPFLCAPRLSLLPRLVPSRRIYLAGERSGRIRLSLASGVSRKALPAPSPLLVEGFPRSGTTFTEVYVSLSVPTHPVWCHSHNPAPLRDKRALLSVVPVREPAEAIGSLWLWQLAAPNTVYWARLSPAAALKHWIRFHLTVLHLLQRGNVFPFPFEMIQDRNLRPLDDFVSSKLSRAPATRNKIELWTHQAIERINRREIRQGVSPLQAHIPTSAVETLREQKAQVIKTVHELPEYDMATDLRSKLLTWPT